jgi:mRNA interferase RelE/StbE
MENSKRATVYFTAEVHKALRLRAAASDRSISDMVNDAVRAALAEDATDLEAFTERRGEKSVSFESAVAEYKILLKSSAAKEIEAVGSKEDRRRIVEKIAGLAVNPRAQKTEKLAGYDDRYRIRQGQYRIVYFIDDSRREVTIFKVGHRKDVYR